MKEFVEKLIERLDDEIDNNPIYDYEKGYSRAICDAIENVNELAVEFATDTNVGDNSWIPVSSGKFPKERILEDGRYYPSEYVLVQYGTGLMDVSRYWNHRYLQDEPIVPWVDIGRFDGERVVAWRPLPGPYKEEGEVK